MHRYRLFPRHFSTTTIACRLLPVILCFAVLAGLSGLETALPAQQDQSAEQAEQPDQPQESEESSDGSSESGLPKLEEMEVPSMEDLLQKDPVDWIVLHNDEVIVAEPVYPRPNTLEKIEQRIAESRNWPRPQTDAEREQQQRDRSQLRMISLTLPGDSEAAEYQLEYTKVKEVIHHEDLMLRRIAKLREEERYRDAFEMLFLLGRKYPDWPGLDEQQDHLIFAEAVTHINAGRSYSAWVYLEQLHERNPDYPNLEERFGEVGELMINQAYEERDFRKTRHFMERLTDKFPQHAVAAKWKQRMRTEAEAKLEKAAEASENDQHDLAVAHAEKAADIWPATPSLQALHAGYFNRFQTLKAGVVRLAGEPTAYPIPARAERRIDVLTRRKLFEFTHFDTTPQFRPLFFEHWLPTDLGREVVFTVRRNRTNWESYPPVTALTIASTLSERLDRDSPVYDERLAGFIESVTVESPTEVRIRFSQVPLQNELLFRFPLVERPPQQQEGSAEAELEVVSQGFRLHQQTDRAHRYRRVVPEPDDASQFHVVEVLEKKYDGHDKAMQGLLRGEVDMLPNVQLWDLEIISRDDRFYVQKYALPTNHVIQFNPDSKPLRNREFRRALSFAINRGRILDAVVLKGANPRLARLATAPFAETSYAHNPVAPQRPHDPVQAFSLTVAARQALKVEQLPDLKMVCDPDPIARAAAREIVRDWSRLGLNVEIVTGEKPPEDWDVIYRTARMIEPVSELWPFLTLESTARVESLAYLPDWLRMDLIELDLAGDWNSATDVAQRLHRQIQELSHVISLWEVDEFLVIRKNIADFPQQPVHAYQGIDRWRVRSWYPKDAR